MATNYYLIDARTNFNISAGQNVVFGNAAFTHNHQPTATTAHRDDVQRGTRASLNHEARRVRGGSRPSLIDAERRSRLGSNSTTSGAHHPSSSTMRRDPQSEDTNTVRGSLHSQSGPSLASVRSSARSITPPPSYASVAPPPPPTTANIPRPRTEMLPPAYEAPPRQPTSNHPHIPRNRPLPPSEIAFTPRTPLCFHQFKKAYHLHGSRAQREFEKELEWRERHCHVDECKDKRVHRTIDVEKRGKKWEDGWGGYHRSGPRTVKLRVESRFCEVHTCRSNGAGRNGVFCKCPKYGWAKYCTCCMETGKEE